MENDTLDLASMSLTGSPSSSNVPSSSTFTLRSSEYSLERLSNGKIYCKIYLLVGLLLAPSSLTSDFTNKHIIYSFTVTLPISLTKVKYCSWTHFDTSVGDSCIIASLKPTKTTVGVYTIQKVPSASGHLTTGEANDIIIKIEGII